MIKNYLKSYLYLFISLIILTLILSIINYFFIIHTKVIKLLIPIISIMISSIILGKNSKQKAYLEGIKFTSIYILLSIILSVIFKNTFNIKLILSYILLMLSGVIGSMIGINLNKKI